MSKRVMRIACVLVVAGLTSQGCLWSKKSTGGTNLGGLGSDTELPPPGQPSAQPDDAGRR